jgi:serine O-acetyltransferase
MFSTIREDIRTVFAKDPAAKSTLEVVLCYPGLHALWMYRMAHFLWRRRFHLLARILSQTTRFLTGIEIHPGAAIGRRFFIDHGAGVVIGETSEIGDDVLLYQGVVLGGTTSEKKKRHPTLGSNVVMGAGAVALGAITIGDGARIGSGSVVIKSVSPGVTVVGIPGRAVEDHRKPIRDLEHGRLPDPVAEAIRLVLKEQDRLEERMERLEKECGLSIAGDELGEERKKIEEEMEPEEP